MKKLFYLSLVFWSILVFLYSVDGDNNVISLEGDPLANSNWSGSAVKAGDVIFTIYESSQHSDNEYYLQGINENGERVLGEFGKKIEIPEEIYSIAMCRNSLDQIWVAFIAQNMEYGYFNIKLMTYDVEGNVIGSVEGLNVYNSWYNSEYLKMKADSTGGCYFLWSSQFGIQACYLNANGAVIEFSLPNDQYIENFNFLEDESGCYILLKNSFSVQLVELTPYGDVNEKLYYSEENTINHSDVLSFQDHFYLFYSHTNDVNLKVFDNSGLNISTVTQTYSDNISSFRKLTGFVLNSEIYLNLEYINSNFLYGDLVKINTTGNQLFSNPAISLFNNSYMYTSSMSRFETDIDQNIHCFFKVRVNNYYQMIKKIINDSGIVTGTQIVDTVHVSSAVVLKKLNDRMFYFWNDRKNNLKFNYCLNGTEFVQPIPFFIRSYNYQYRSFKIQSNSLTNLLILNYIKEDESNVTFLHSQVLQNTMLMANGNIPFNKPDYSYVTHFSSDMYFSSGMWVVWSELKQDSVFIYIQKKYIDGGVYYDEKQLVACFQNLSFSNLYVSNVYGIPIIFWENNHTLYAQQWNNNAIVWNPEGKILLTNVNLIDCFDNYLIIKSINQSLLFPFNQNADLPEENPSLIPLQININQISSYEIRKIDNKILLLWVEHIGAQYILKAQVIENGILSGMYDLLQSAHQEMKFCTKDEKLFVLTKDNDLTVSAFNLASLSFLFSCDYLAGTAQGDFEMVNLLKYGEYLYLFYKQNFNLKIQPVKVLQNQFETQPILPFNESIKSDIYLVNGYNNCFHVVFWEKGLTDYALKAVRINTASLVENNDEVAISSLDVYPNPFKDQISIVINESKKCKADLSLYNIKGQCVYRDKIDLLNGKNNLTIMPEQIGSLASGVYFCRIKTPDHQVIRKVIKLN